MIPLVGIAAFIALLLGVDWIADKRGWFAEPEDNIIEGPWVHTDEHLPPAHGGHR